MNSFTFETLKVGQTEKFLVQITQSMLTSFLELTSDNNPLHIDSDFAKTRGFPGKVAYGMMTASFYSTLVGVYLPGRFAMLHGIEIKFRNPSYKGDTLVITGEVSFTSQSSKQIELKANIKNQDNLTISTAKIKVGLHE
jgi:3-hydroxybutyryl-CoA dehydratase